MSGPYPCTPPRNNCPPILPAPGRKRPLSSPVTEERKPRSRRATLSTSTLQLQLQSAIMSSPLLPAASVFPPFSPIIDRREVMVGDFNEMIRRSPGLRNLNIFTRCALAEDHDLSSTKKEQLQESLDLWSFPSRRDTLCRQELSSPELPDSPESPYHSEDDASTSSTGLTSDEDDEDFSPSPCVARRVIGEVHRAHLGSTPTRVVTPKCYEQTGILSPSLAALELLSLSSSPRYDWERSSSLKQGIEPFHPWGNEATQGLGLM